MCGRCACNLAPEEIRRACCYRDDASGKSREIQWMKSETQFVPSCNIGPRDVLPCIAAGKSFGAEDERVLCRMMWGMIAPWTTGDYRKHNMSTHNARIESIRDSRLYSPALRRGQRCVVVCEGFYEWKAGQTKKDAKQPYYVYVARERDVTAGESCRESDERSVEQGWKGPELLKMAGVYGMFKTAEDKVVYSCTIITKDADDILSWLHHRSPAFLLTESNVRMWLDKTLTADEALDKLKEVKLSDGALKWYPVSTLVNNISNKGEDCKKEIQLVEGKRNASTDFMASWLKRSEVTKKRSGANEDDDKHSSKIPKKQ